MHQNWDKLKILQVDNNFHLYKNNIICTYLSKYFYQVLCIITRIEWCPQKKFLLIFLKYNFFFLLSS